MTLNVSLKLHFENYKIVSAVQINEAELDQIGD